MFDAEAAAGAAAGTGAGGAMRPAVPAAQICSVCDHFGLHTVLESKPGRKQLQCPRCAPGETRTLPILLGELDGRFKEVIITHNFHAERS